jgi:hypothetical protein
MSEVIDTKSLRLAANYIECVREILKELYPDEIPTSVQEKYKMKKLENGTIDIQFPESA